MINGNTPERTIQNGVKAGAAIPSGRAIYEQRKQYGKSKANNGEISQYSVEHLTTFALDRKDGMMTVEDGIRKLKLLDARGKIWTQEALMQVDEKTLKLFDQNTQEELENFPLSAVQQVQIVLDTDPYSIVAVIVKAPDQKIADMHLFHCPMVPADIVGADVESAVADCKDKKGRKIRPDTLRRTRERVQASVIPPPPHDPPPAPPMKDGNVRERIQNWDNIVLTGDVLSEGDTIESVEFRKQETQRYVQILNHVLDDIEFFISQLQKSAEASKELSLRRGSKKQKSKKYSTGSGMLTLRAKPPPFDRFIDCYRKFKLAFNLLAKLKNQIQNPNAIEIVHFLFAPLEMCVRACGGADIPRSVESPLLTPDSIDLLRNCLTTHEMQLWNNLGDFWNKSRQDFPEGYYFAPYDPQFGSGWQPQPPTMGEGRSAGTPATLAVMVDQVTRAEEARRVSDTSIREAPPNLLIHREPSFSNAPYAGVVPLSAEKAKMCRAMFIYSARNPQELTVNQDELLEVLDDSKSWWKVKNRQGRVGFVPGQMMAQISNNKSSSTGSSVTSGGPIPSPPPVAPAVVPVPVPAPPPPPPPPFTSMAKPVKVMPVPGNGRMPAAKLNPVGVNNAMNHKNVAPNAQTYAAVNKPVRKNMSLEALQQELRGRVSTTQAQQRNFSIPKKKANSASIKLTKRSSKAEVRRWLESLNFSQLTIDSLGVLTGEQIFTLTKDELKMICEEDGGRVFSQLQVQKSQAKEERTGTNELTAILQIQKMKADGE